MSFAKALKTSIVLSVLFCIVYGGTNWFAANRHDIPSFYFPWEHHIPFIPWMILPYMSIDLFFWMAPFLCQSEIELRTLFRRIAGAIVISGAFFLLVPLKFAFGRPPVEGTFGLIFNNFRNFDQPFNQFPSLHIALAVILAIHYARKARGPLRFGIIAWFGLVCVSTLFTYQHHVIDLAGGFALGALCVYLFQDEPLRSAGTGNGKAARMYALSAICMGAMAIATRPIGLVLFWPAISLGLIAAGYFHYGAGIYRKSNGKIAPVAEWILWPTRLGQWLSWLHYRRQCDPWHRLTDRVWIGRRLTQREARSAIDSGVTAVLDLTCEFSEAKPFLTVKYLHLSVLDLTAPTNEQLSTAVNFLTTESTNGIVYVHCKAGYSRTAAAAGAYLLASGKAENVEHALSFMRAARPSIIIRPEVVDALRIYDPQRESSARNPETEPRMEQCCAAP